MTAPRIILGVTGSIAACKAPELAGLLTRQGYDVTAVLTASAAEFVTPLTMQTLTRNPVVTGIFEESPGWRPGHIELADRASLILIAPATANILAKLAAGIADDALTAICLATRAPILHAPAMNGKMWEHPATQRNVRTLEEWGHAFLGPDTGMLACGYEGAGRLWPVEAIAVRVREIVPGGAGADEGEDGTCP